MVTGVPPCNLLVFSFVRILEPTVGELVLITGNYPEEDVFSSRIKLINIDRESGRQSMLGGLPRFGLRQLKTLFHLGRNMRHASIVVFFLEGGMSLLPMLAARLAGKKTVMVVTYSSPQVLRERYLNSVGGMLLRGVSSLFERVNYGLAHRLVVYSPTVVSCFGLETFRHKISIAPRHFLDFETFVAQKPLHEREALVGYIGRLSSEKGIIKFLDAIPEVLKTADDVTFLIGGDGPLRSRVEQYAAEPERRTSYAGWVSREELPHYLNRLKLLVIPSYTEGLPNIMLEAMACGTPVLATPVGAIPDIIVDGESGFLMESNSPECIADNISRALRHPDLERIARNARALVERDFTFEKAVDRYRRILQAVSS